MLANAVSSVRVRLGEGEEEEEELVVTRLR